MVKRFLEFIRLARETFWSYRRQIALLTLLGFVSGILGGVGINALIPLFSLALGKQHEADFVTRGIERLFYWLGIDFSVSYLLGFIVLLFIVKAAVLIVISYMGTKIAADYEATTRSRLLRAIVHARWPYLVAQKLGYVDTILMRNVVESRNFLAQISAFIMTLSSLIVYAALAVNISPVVTAITLALGCVLFVASRPLITRVKVLALEEESIHREIAHYVNEHLLGMKIVKAFGVARVVADQGARYFRRIRDIRLKSFALAFASNNLVQPASVVFIAGVFAVSYSLPGFSIVAFAAVIYLIRQIFNYIEQLQTVIFGFFSTMPYVRMVREYEKSAGKAREAEGGGKPFSFTREIAFDDVSFVYEDGRQALSHVSFAVSKGEMVGLIGPTGAGKTTTVDLILRLLEPTGGEIRLDAVPARAIALEAWRARIGYVTQDSFLLNGTIETNIRFYDETLTREEIRAAARLAQADFVERLPQGFDTPVGERGILLSGGERQRLAIARVLARKPDLLILDEATSALDNESEARIRGVMAELKGKMTVVVIAHRLSTVMRSDRLIAFENGRVLEIGSPHTLLKNKNSYLFKVYNIRE
jgi:ABC-type multidrug transport system fused ATPase/permease subunit